MCLLHCSFKIPEIGGLRNSDLDMEVRGTKRLVCDGDGQMELIKHLQG